MWSFQISTLDCLEKDGPLAIHEVKEQERGPQRKIKTQETLTESGRAGAQIKIASSASFKLYFGSQIKTQLYVFTR